ncbi:MAG: DUF177 domain-containing protein [Magnetococcus sp. YQC-5]
METSSYPVDFSDPMVSLTRGFHGAVPRDLSGVVLDLATMGNRTSLWSAHGIIPPTCFQELNAVGVVEEPVELYLLANPIHQDGKIRVRVRGRCWSQIQVACVRCLIEFSLPLEVEIDAFYAAGKDPALQNKRWQMEEDVVFLADGILKLPGLAEEELLLALPMNPVCNTECAGLCPGCGADLNHHPCECRLEPTGPFAVLKKLQSI